MISDTYTDEVNKYANLMDFGELKHYVYRVFTYLKDLYPGVVIPVKHLAEPESIDLFKAVVKMYISQTDYCPIEFTNDYSGIKSIGHFNPDEEKKVSIFESSRNSYYQRNQLKNLS